MKKKDSILLFYLKMMIIGTFILLVSTLIPAILTGSLLSSKYGFDAVAELLMALIVLVVLLRYGNGYIFKERGEKFYKGLFLAGPFTFILLMTLLINIPEAMNAPLGNVVNVIILCFAIGVFEEFLCRGWIQNEFIERFGDTRKGVILSIFCSSIIFGGFHILNLVSGQPLLETILQALQATSSGFLLGAIFFRTKNIWSVVFLHALYDLAIFLGEAGLYKDCTTLADPGTIGMLYQYGVSLLIVAIYFLTAFYILRKEKTDHLIEQQFKEPTQKEKKKYNIVKYAIFGLTLLLFAPAPKEVPNMNVCYDFGEISYKVAYETHYTNYNKYSLKQESFNFEFEQDEDYNLYITNKATDKKVRLAKDIDSFEVIENDSYFILVISKEFNAYYVKEYYNKIDNTNDFLETFKKNIKQLDVPEVSEIGYITSEDTTEKLPIVKSTINDIFVIETNKDIKVIK